MEITTDRNSRILSYKKLFFNIACSYALSPEEVTQCFTDTMMALLLGEQLYYPGNCHCQPHIDSIGPDRLADNVLSVPI